MERKLKIIMLLIVFFGIVSASFSPLVFTYLFKETVSQRISTLEEKDYIIQNIIVDSIMESSVNRDIEQHLKDGKGESIYKFYDRITGYRDITYRIIEQCLYFDVPINIALALCYEESRFYIYAENGIHNKDGSADYGLFQLNSYVYSEYEKEYLMDINNNIRFGIQHLRSDYEEYGDWFKAVIAYNSGSISDVPESTIHHMAKIFNRAREYDRMYWELRSK